VLVAALGKLEEAVVVAQAALQRRWWWWWMVLVNMMIVVLLNGGHLSHTPSINYGDEQHCNVGLTLPFWGWEDPRRF